MMLYVGEEANTLDTESWRMKPRAIFFPAQGS